MCIPIYNNDVFWKENCLRHENLLFSNKLFSLKIYSVFVHIGTLRLHINIFSLPDLIYINIIIYVFWCNFLHRILH